jgi:hypothetical protein
MKGSDFQCQREYLGLSAAWVADRLEVNRKTVWRWEREETSLPDKASRAMQAWVHNTSVAVGKLTVAAAEAEGQPLLATPDEGFEHMAVEGFPASWQRMLCARVAERTGKPIQWMPLPDKEIEL